MLMNSEAVYSYIYNMLGAITGDTIGSVYEFHNTKEYNFTLFFEESSYTDDSVMTMAVAYWLLRDPSLSYQELENIMVEFAKDCPCPMGGYGGGFYRWLFFPKKLYVFNDRYGTLPYESPAGRHPYGSFGNGSAMRVSAVGWFFDTLACITGGVAEAFYGGVPGTLATRVLEKVPVAFKKILEAARKFTAYGNCP